MSDQNNDTGPVRPQVIDLEAEEIRSSAEDTSRTNTEDAREDAAAGSTTPPPPKRSGRGAASWIVAALILGALGGGWLYRGVLSSYLPTNEMTALRNQIAALEQNHSGLQSEIGAVKQSAEGAAQQAASAGDAAAQAANAAKAAAEQIGSIGSRLDQTEQRAAGLEEQIAAARADLDGLRNAMAAAPSGASGSAAPADPAGGAALTALTQRIEALEKEVASLKSGAGAKPEAGVTAALSQALSDLKAKIAAGTSYQAEYDRIARMVPAAAGLDVVAAHAAEGLPDARGLAAELTAAIPALPQPAAPAAEDDSYFGTLMKSLSGIISIRPIGETDWPQLAQKAAAFAEAGDLTQAISVIDAGEGDKPVALTQWRDRAAARLQLEAALSQVSEAVLRQITALGGGGTP